MLDDAIMGDGNNLLVSKDLKSLKLNEQDYEIIAPHVVAATNAIMYAKEKLGNPTSPTSEQGKKLMHVIVSVWEDLLPVEARDWHEARKDYQSNELDISTQVKNHTGRSLASVPLFIHKIMNLVFPDFDSSKRESYIDLVKAFPMFRMANKI